jgi:hypothetical protein
MSASKRRGKYPREAGAAHCYHIDVAVGYKGNVVAWWAWNVCIFELFDYIPRYQNVQGSVIVIPLQLDATVQVDVPILGEFVLVLEAFYQMVDIVLVDVLHTKVVNHQGESDGSRCVFPKSRCLLVFVVSVGI